MLKNLRIVCFLVLGFSRIYYGIIRASSIMEDGGLFLMDKARSLARGSNMLLANINIKEPFKTEKGQGLV